MIQPSSTISPASVSDIRDMRSGNIGQAVSSWLPSVQCALIIMPIGQIYFDNSTDPAEAKLLRLIECYKKKYGAEPHMILIHSEYIAEAAKASLPCPVRVYKHVLPNHFWVYRDAPMEMPARGGDE